MIRNSISIICMSLLVVGCSEVNGPGEIEGLESNPVSDVATATDTNPILPAPPGTLAHRTDAPPLETYSTSFQAVQGKITNFSIRYVDPSQPDSTAEWFAKITIPREAQFVDENGVNVADGDTVTVTVDVDPTRFFVRFGPHGSQFGGDKTAELTYNLKYADLGERDIRDATIWYQPSTDYEWSVEPSVVEVSRMHISIHLRHFSNYAVAW